MHHDLVSNLVFQTPIGVLHHGGHSLYFPHNYSGDHVHHCCHGDSNCHHHDHHCTDLAYS